MIYVFVTISIGAVILAADQARRLFVWRARLATFVDAHEGVTILRNEMIKHESALKDIRNNLERARQDAKDEKSEIENDIEELKKNRLYEAEEHAVRESGLYRKTFQFATKSEYAKRLDQNYEEQKHLISAENAIHFAKKWVVENSEAKGRKMQGQYAKLLLRAFNGESDALAAKVSVKNIETFQERLQRSFEALNKLGAMIDISITPRFLLLKRQELALGHELQVHLFEEKENLKAKREEERERKREEEAIERQKRDVEKDGLRLQKNKAEALRDLAKAEAAHRSERELEVLRAKVKGYEDQIRANEVFLRKISVAETTRKGNVYVISNVGAFGDGVFKIGMTRRIFPEERIEELGDASVPFSFDVHGMIETDDAPQLEHKLHEIFRQNAVNLVNERKEFFRVSLGDVQKALKKLKIDYQLSAEAPCEDFRESMRRRTT